MKATGCGRRLRWLVALQLAITPGLAHAAETAASAEADAVPGENVYVGNDETYYHAIDCRRLHFGRVAPLAELKSTRQPCPVCLGSEAKPRATSVAPVPRVPAASPPVAATDVPPVPPRRAGRDHSIRNGMLIGTVAGFVLGYIVGSSEHNCVFPGTGCPHLVPPAAVGAMFAGAGTGLGALVGALTRSHSDERAAARFDAALERGREAVAAARITPGPSPPNAEDRRPSVCVHREQDERELEPLAAGAAIALR